MLFSLSMSASQARQPLAPINERHWLMVYVCWKCHYWANNKRNPEIGTTRQVCTSVEEKSDSVRSQNSLPRFMSAENVIIEPRGTPVIGSGISVNIKMTLRRFLRAEIGTTRQESTSVYEKSSSVRSRNSLPRFMSAKSVIIEPRGTPVLGSGNLVSIKMTLPRFLKAEIFTIKTTEQFASLTISMCFECNFVDWMKLEGGGGGRAHIQQKC